MNRRLINLKKKLLSGQFGSISVFDLRTMRSHFIIENAVIGSIVMAPYLHGKTLPLGSTASYSLICIKP